MEPMLLYALLVFTLVSVTVYIILQRSRDSVGEEAARLHGNWTRYYGEGHPMEMGSSLSAAGSVRRERFRQFLKGLTVNKVSAETETLYFVLQFLMYMESGMTIMSALQKTQASIEAAGYKLAEDLRKINFKLQGGVPFDEAINVLDESERGKSVKEFFLVISQAQEIGVPVSDALKGAIKEFEELRVIRAEERASRLSVLMAIPIVLGFLPSILLLVAMPAVSKLLEAFG